MISVDGGRKMPCESCGVQFSVFRRKRACSECERLYCAACLRRGGGICSPCRALSTRPLVRQNIAHLKVRDLQCFLQRQNISTRGCVEKEELVSLCVSHVNSAAYRRRGANGNGNRNSGPFTTLKGFTNNINDMINCAFDLRPAPASPPAPQPTQPHSNCYNAGHAHAAPAPPPAAPAPPRERFTTNPGGERDFRVPPPAPAPGAGGAGGAGGEEGVSRSSSGGSARRDTADCFEVEDLDDSGWEFVARPPADPLPGDSEILIVPNTNNVNTFEGPELRESCQPRPSCVARSRSQGGGGGSGGGAGPGAQHTPQRAASELDLRRAGSPASAAAADHAADTTSLQDEPLMDSQRDTSPKPITLDAISDESELEKLSVRQLKELLARNRVEFRGCLERADLLARARTLLQAHARYRDEVDALPLEECCKICMAAPLECVLLECGHIAACTRCATQLAECPICRQYVVRAVRFFRS